MNRARWVGPGRLVLTTAAASGLVALATLSPMSQAGARPDAAGDRPATLAPVSSASLSCPGPELSGVADVEDIPVPAAVGAATAPQSVLDPVRTAGRGSLVVRAPGPSDAVGTRGATTTVPTTPGRAVDVLGTGAMAPGLAAAQEWSVARPEIGGLATVPCTGPGSDLWLLAGGGAAGRQERLVLTNPGANEVSVDVQAFGLKGPLASPTGSTVVPARGRVAMLVDAITGAEKSPAVRVRASGGSVRAVMSDMWLDGSVPAGAETTVPTAPPSTRQVIPAAMISGSGSIRIVVPGTRQAVVSARIIDEDGASPLPGGGVARVAARSTGELSVGNLKHDVYAVELTSDVPVAASLFASWRKGSDRGDFAWAPSTSAATGLLGAAYPQAAEPRRRSLNVVATGGPAGVSVTWRSAGAWQSKSVDLSQDTAATFDLGAAESVWVRRMSGTGEVRAGVGTLLGANPDFVSVSPLTESAVTSAVSRAHPAS